MATNFYNRTCRRIFALAIVLPLLALNTTDSPSRADDPPKPAQPTEPEPAEKPATEKPVVPPDFHLAAPNYKHFRQLTFDWLTDQEQLKDTDREQLQELWPKSMEAPTADALLANIVTTFVEADPETGRLIETCELHSLTDPIPQFTFLFEKHDSPFYQNHIKLHLGHYLVQRSLFDAALDILKTIDPQQVVDPATLFFDLAVCHHQLLQKKEALASVAVLLENPDVIPSRYVVLARLMKNDLEELKSEPVGEIAHLMKDSQRRLRLAQSDAKVREVQTDIVERLDKLIEQIENNKNNSSQSSSSGQQAQGPSQGADDSRVKGVAGEGKVDKKKFKSKGGWGALPPKERARAKNLIDRQFPPHYRRQVEQYFKKLSKRRAPTGR